VAAITVRTPSWRFVAIVMLAGAVITPAPAATHKRHKKPPACPSGRYLVRGAALIPAAAPPSVDAVVVQDQDVGIDSGCPVSKGRVTPMTQGTQVLGKWASCGPLEGVRLRAVTESGCNTLVGGLRAKRYSTRRFFATRSKCGDGIVDVAGGEQCDVFYGCAPPATCTNRCRCKALPPSTSTTTTTTLGAP
jgi:hypothetical protein